MPNVTLDAQINAYWLDHVEGFVKGAPRDPLIADYYDYHKVTPEVLEAFQAAMLKIEGMLYAVFGANPDYGHFQDTTTSSGLPVWATAPLDDGGNLPGRGSPNPATRDKQKDWFELGNPRCLWPGVEASHTTPNLLFNTQSLFCTFKRRYLWVPYLAMGHIPKEDYEGQDGGVNNPGEIRGARVPVRSRSGDPKLQYGMALHDKSYFPSDSVERDASDMSDPDQPGDPLPRQPIEVRWTIPNGVLMPSGVTLHWAGAVSGSAGMSRAEGVYSATIPMADVHDDKVDWWIVVSPHADDEDSRTIYEPGGRGVSPRSTLGIVETDDWHIRIGGRQFFGAIFSDWRYSYIIFRHIVGPFANGFPELLADHLGAPYNNWNDDNYKRVHVDGETPSKGNNWGDPGNLKKGTESWRFDALENINVEIINMARHALTRLGEVCHHNPKRRNINEAFADDNVLCCFEMPIVWKWSGSAPHWLWRAGGKGYSAEQMDFDNKVPFPDAIPVKPLHNKPNEGLGGVSFDGGEVFVGAAHTAPRRSWRGIGDGRHSIYDKNNLGLFTGPEFDQPGGGSPDENYEDVQRYGGDASWWTVPNAVVAQRVQDSTLCLDVDVCDEAACRAKFYQRGNKVGLQSGDVISATHLKEIIAATAYLFNEGCWRLTSISSLLKSPTNTENSFDFIHFPLTGRTGLRCGNFGLGALRWYDGSPVADSGDFRGSCSPCSTLEGEPSSFPNETCPAGEETCCNACGDDDACREPTWEECQGFHSNCSIETGAFFRTLFHPPISKSGAASMRCTRSANFRFSTSFAASFCFDTGQINRDRCQNNIGLDLRDVRTRGWSAYLCGPARSDRGPGGSSIGGWHGGTDGSGRDEKHGNGITIQFRRRIDWDVNGLQCTYNNTNFMMSFGNSWDTDIIPVTCGESENNPGGITTEVPFKTVIGAQLISPSLAWWRIAWSNNAWSDWRDVRCPPPELPGFGKTTVPDRNGNTEPLCIGPFCYTGGGRCTDRSWCRPPEREPGLNPEYCCDDYEADCYDDFVCQNMAGWTQFYCDTGELNLAGCNGRNVWARVNWNEFNGVPRLYDYLDPLNGSVGGDGSDLYWIDNCNCCGNCNPDDPRDIDCADVHPPGCQGHPFGDQIPWSSCPCQTSLRVDDDLGFGDAGICQFPAYDLDIRFGSPCCSGICG